MKYMAMSLAFVTFLSLPTWADIFNNYNITEEEPSYGAYKKGEVLEVTRDVKLKLVSESQLAQWGGAVAVDGLWRFQTGVMDLNLSGLESVNGSTKNNGAKSNASYDLVCSDCSLTLRHQQKLLVEKTAAGKNLPVLGTMMDLGNYYFVKVILLDSKGNKTNDGFTFVNKSAPFNMSFLMKIDPSL